MKETVTLRNQIEMKERASVNQVAAFQRAMEDKQGRIMETRRELEIATRHKHELGTQLSKLMQSTLSALEKAEPFQIQTGKAIQKLVAERASLQSRLLESSRDYEARLERKSKEAAALTDQVRFLQQQAAEERIVTRRRCSCGERVARMRKRCEAAPLSIA